MGGPVVAREITIPGIGALVFDGPEAGLAKVVTDRDSRFDHKNQIGFLVNLG